MTTNTDTATHLTDKNLSQTTRSLDVTISRIGDQALRYSK